MKNASMLLWVVLFASMASAQENATLARAKSIYFRESVDAIDAYLAKEKAALQKVAKAYDQAITAAMKSGGEKGLDEANALKAEKRQFLEKHGQLGDFKMPGVAVPTKDEIVNHLTNKNWMWHWDRKWDKPARFSPDGRWRIEREDDSSVPLRQYSVNLVWAITVPSTHEKHGSFMLIMIDPNTIHGFEVPSGKRVGAYTK